MSKKYLVNQLFNNNDISIHLAETVNHYVIEQNFGSRRFNISISKSTKNSKERSVLLFKEKLWIIRKIIDSTNFNKY